MTGAESITTIPDVGAGYPDAVTVEIRGVTEAATFARLADAVEAVRTTLAGLPMDDGHAEYLAELFAPDALDRIARQLADFGAVRAIAFLGIEAHPISLRPAAR